MKLLQLIKGLIPEIFTAGFLFMCFSNVLVSVMSGKKTFDRLDEIEHRSVGLVLGTSKYLKSGNINLYFQYRVEAAAELYHANKVDYLLISGDNSRIAYNEPEDFKQSLVGMGVPESKIYLDYAGFRTLDSVIRSKAVFRLNKLTIISQKFHNERAIFLAQSKGIDAIGYNAKDVQRYSYSAHLREFIARGGALFDILFKTRPKYYGPQIRIG